MQDGPLLVSGILRRGQAVYGDSAVITVQTDGYRESTFTQVAARAEQLAESLASPRCRPGRPGRHIRLERPGAPRGVPGDPLDGGGAAHAQHPPLPRAAGLRGQPCRGQGRHRRRLDRPAVRPGPRRVQDGGAHHRRGRGGHDGPRATRCPTTSSSAPRSRATTGPSSTNARPRRCATRAAPPATRRASSTATVRRGCTPSPGMIGQLRGRQRTRPRPRHRSHVPRQRLGDALHGVLRRDRPHLPRAVPPSRAAHPDHRRAAPHPVAGGSHHLERPLALLPEPRRRPVVAAAPHRRRLGGAALAHGGVPGPFRHRHDPGLGDDRDKPGVRLRPRPQGRSSRAGDGLAGQDGSHHRRGGAPGRGRGGRGAPQRRDRRWASSRSEAPGSRPRTTGIPAPSGSTTDGCAPGTWGVSTAGASCRSRTAPRTSSSPGGSGSRRSSSRTR